MKKKYCLLHLVSGQTMQNLLPVLALQPQEVVQVRSNSGEFGKRADSLRTAAAELGFKGEILPDEVIPHESPSIEDTANYIRKILNSRPDVSWIINITGGTKMMSIGAFEAAGREYTSFYCDTANRAEITHTGGPELPEHEDLTRVISCLTVKAVMAAHGVDPEGLHSGVPDKSKMDFAQEVTRLRGEGGDTIAVYLSDMRKNFYTNGQFIAKARIKNALSTPLPGCSSDAVDAFLSASKTAGFVREIMGSFYLNPAQACCVNSKEAVKQARSNFKALEGGWWEMEVFRICRESDRFIDLQSEVQAASQEEAIGESDLLGISRRNRGLTFISCKVSDEHVKPLEHAFEFTQRARQFGGSAAKAVFVFHGMRNDAKRRQLDSACRVLGSNLIVGAAELEKWLQDRA